MRELALERPLQMLWRREITQLETWLCIHQKSHCREILKMWWMCEILHQRPTFIPTYKPPHRREDLYLEWPWKSFQWIFIPSKSWTHSHWRETTWVSSMCKSIRWRHDRSHHVKSHEWRRAFRCPSHIYMHRECRKRHPMSAINEVDPPARSFFS